RVAFALNRAFINILTSTRKVNTFLEKNSHSPLKPIPHTPFPQQTHFRQILRRADFKLWDFSFACAWSLWWLLRGA
ncbi:hypothetical protein, partial [Synechocystis sp. CS-94]|uniref:hypothetical protein n=1 Tax=Synechocystis sp. CS-94 TaxID=2847986 RepID=UPI00223B5B61